MRLPHAYGVPAQTRDNSCLTSCLATVFDTASVCFIQSIVTEHPSFQSETCLDRLEYLRFNESISPGGAVGSQSMSGSRHRSDVGSSTLFRQHFGEARWEGSSLVGSVGEIMLRRALFLFSGKQRIDLSSSRYQHLRCPFGFGAGSRPCPQRPLR